MLLSPLFLFCLWAARKTEPDPQRLSISKEKLNVISSSVLVKEAANFHGDIVSYFLGERDWGKCSKVELCKCLLDQVLSPKAWLHLSPMRGAVWTCISGQAIRPSSTGPPCYVHFPLFLQLRWVQTGARVWRKVQENEKKETGNT